MVTQIEVAIASVALAFGLVHGTYDWLLLGRVYRGKAIFDDLLDTTLLYIGIGVPYILTWFIAPDISLLIFLLFTIIHWGQEELYFVKEILAVEVGDSVDKALLILSKGGMTVIFPLVYYHNDYHLVVDTILSLFNHSGTLDWFFIYEVRIILVSTITLSMFAYTIISEDRRDGIFTFGLAAWFLYVPVAISIPVYLALVHTPIHMTRYKRLSQEQYSGFIKESLPYGIGAILMYIAGALFIPNATSSLLNMASLYLVLLAVLTLPHTFICLLIDRQEGLY